MRYIKLGALFAALLVLLWGCGSKSSSSVRTEPPKPKPKPRYYSDLGNALGSVMSPTLQGMSEGIEQAEEEKKYPGRITDVEILEYGLFTGDKIKLHTNSFSMKNRRLVKTTTNIPARKNTIFGIRYKIKGYPDNAKVRIDVMINHPLMHPPKGHAYNLTQNRKIVKRIGSTNTWLFMFGYDWERVPGKYRFRIGYRHTVMAEKTFYVHKPVKK